MEYQKTINLSDNTSNQPTKFRAKNWVEINDDARETHNKDFKFKPSMLKSGLCDYGVAYILAKRTITIAPVSSPVANPNDNDKEVILCSTYWLHKWNKQYTNR